MDNTNNFQVDQVRQVAEKELNENLLPGLSKFIEIPNLSPQFDQDWQTNGLQEQAANHIIDWIKSQNLQNLKTLELITDGKDKPPLIFVEIDSNIKNSNQPATTALFYGHYDKQPHFTGWAEGLGPTKPVIRDGWLYGRGGIDDGYAAFTSITAIKVLQLLNLPHPRCVMTFEGEEESGSASYMHYINMLTQKIGTPDYIFCLDSGCLDYETLWITSSLRGYIDGVINVKVLTEGVHSGDASGIIPSSFRILRNVLDRIECSKTGKVHDEFFVDIPPNRYKEAQEVASQEHKRCGMKLNEKTEIMAKNNFQAYLNRTWRPTVSYIGADNLPPTKVAGNVLRPLTSLAINMRTPPTLNSKEKSQKLKELIEQDPPHNAKVTFDSIETGVGWNAREYSDKLQKSLESASLNFFKKELKCLGEGGSIPLMVELQQKYPQLQFIVTGLGGPNSNAHAQNEALNLYGLKNFLCCMIQVLNNTSQ